MGFYIKVYEQVKRIPKGCVTTYGHIAHLSGSPRAAKAVGNALHANPEPGTIPCHRVVNCQGYLSGGFAFGGIDRQKLLLENEGVRVDGNYKVDLKKYGWKM